MGVLERPKGHVDLITSLLNTEIRSSSPSDAVVILGAQERYFEKVPNGALETPRGNKPLFFAIQFVPAPRLVSDSTPTDVGGVRDPRTAHPSTALRTVLITPGNFDTISDVIRRLKGKAIQVLTPDQFEKAIEDVESSRLRLH